MPYSNSNLELENPFIGSHRVRAAGCWKQSQHGLASRAYPVLQLALPNNAAHYANVIGELTDVEIAMPCELSRKTSCAADVEKCKSKIDCADSCQMETLAFFHSSTPLDFLKG